MPFSSYMLVRLAALFLAAALLPAADTIVLVRHAEKAAAPADNPGLTPAGQARAQALARTLGDAGIQVIITSKFERTRATARPIAQRLGITPEVITEVPAVVARLRTLPAETKVLVVHHSNTLPEIIHALGAGTVEPIAEGEYDRMLVVTGTRMLKLRYGR